MSRRALACAILAAALASSAALAQQTAPAPAQGVVTQPVADASDDQKMVCRSATDTGSLVKKTKRCHTKAQWRYIDDTNQQFSRQMADDMRSKGGSN